jgi:hypothetical protein
MIPDPRTITWIASYPKSGNTWLRFLACNLLFGRQESAAALNQLVPDMHELRQDDPLPAARQVIKTHFSTDRLKSVLPKTAAAVYIVRNPADVMLSNFHYLQRGGDSSTTLSEYVEAFIANRGAPVWIRAGMGSWKENVRGWWQGDLPFPVLKLRYEDMLADPSAGARSLSELLGVKSSEEDIQRAVADSSFERLRQIEEADIRAKRDSIFYKPTLQGPLDSGLRFMRSGKSGDAADAFTGDQKARFMRAFGPLMRELGYPVET